MNVYRKVIYDDDGCDLYQCLACKCEWSGRFSYSPINYCLHCGVKFDSPDPIKCRPHNQPAWHFKRYGHEDDNHDAPDYWNRTPQPASDWSVTEAMLEGLSDGDDYPFGDRQDFPHSWTAARIWNWIDVQVRGRYYDKIVRVEKGGQSKLFYVPQIETQRVPAK